MMMTSKRPKVLASGKSLPLPLSLILTGFICVVGIVAAYLRRTANFSVAFGDTLMIGAFAMFGLSWVGYLKKDGVRFVPPKKSSDAKAPESWADRVPSLGKAPSPPPPIPGAEGPNSDDYQHLADAENRLREKILGREPEGDEKAAYSAKNRDFMKSSAISGLMLMILALCFEYLIPLLSYRNRF